MSAICCCAVIISVASYILFKETITVMTMIGMAVMLTGITILAFSQGTISSDIAVEDELSPAVPICLCNDLLSNILALLASLCYST
jgi:drug/metabolite transporter (DMT)-like permease